MNSLEMLESLLKDEEISKKRKIRILLKFIDIRQSKPAYAYIYDAILFILEGRSKSIFEEVGKKYKHSGSTIEREITLENNKILWNDFNDEHKNIKKYVLGTYNRCDGVKAIDFVYALTNFIREFEVEE